MDCFLQATAIALRHVPTSFHGLNVYMLYLFLLAICPRQNDKQRVYFFILLFLQAKGLKADKPKCIDCSASDGHVASKSPSSEHPFRTMEWLPSNVHKPLASFLTTSPQSPQAPPSLPFQPYWALAGFLEQRSFFPTSGPLHCLCLPPGKLTPWASQSFMSLPQSPFWTILSKIGVSCQNIFYSSIPLQWSSEFVSI